MSARRRETRREETERQADAARRDARHDVYRGGAFHGPGYKVACAAGCGTGTLRHLWFCEACWLILTPTQRRAFVGGTSRDNARLSDPETFGKVLGAIRAARDQRAASERDAAARRIGADVFCMCAVGADEPDGATCHACGKVVG